MMAIWIKTPPDAEPVWMAADNRIRELALSIERRAGIAPDADGLRQIREWQQRLFASATWWSVFRDRQNRRGRASCRMRSCGAAKMLCCRGAGADDPGGKSGSTAGRVQRAV